MVTMWRTRHSDLLDWSSRAAENNVACLLFARQKEVCVRSSLRCTRRHLHLHVSLSLLGLLVPSILHVKSHLPSQIGATASIQAPTKSLPYGVYVLIMPWVHSTPHIQFSFPVIFLARAARVCTVHTTTYSVSKCKEQHYHGR